MKTFYYLFSICFCLIPNVVFADMKIQANASTIFSVDNPIRPAVYKISQREFSKSDALAKLDYLKSLGFSYSKKQDTGKTAIYKNESSGQYLSYSPYNSEYFYYDPKMGRFTEKDRADTNQIRSMADKYLKGLLGEDSKNFRLQDKRLRYMAGRGDTMPKLCNVTFRYVRVLDGRLITGRTNHIMIRLGQDCQLSQFQINDNNFEKVRDLDMKIKNSAMPKYLADHVSSKEYSSAPYNGIEHPIKNTSIIKGREAYYEQKIGESDYLEPCISFSSTDTLLDGSAIDREFRLTVDAAKIPNITEKEFIDYEARSKK
jgi:hypothetical protein